VGEAEEGEAIVYGERGHFDPKNRDIALAYTRRDDHMTITQLTGLLGLIFGIVGTVLGVFNYLRDRAVVRVSRQWDMTMASGPRSSNEKMGLIRVANIGRRPIFVSHVALRLPKGFSKTHLVVSGGIAGVRLGESDPVQAYPVTQEGLEEYASVWPKIVAQVTDASGREWFSKPNRNQKMPSRARTA
jgi:hypothetical protein